MASKMVDMLISLTVRHRLVAENFLFLSRFSEQLADSRQTNLEASKTYLGGEEDQEVVNYDIRFFLEKPETRPVSSLGFFIKNVCVQF